MPSFLLQCPSSAFTCIPVVQLEYVAIYGLLRSEWRDALFENVRDLLPELLTTRREQCFSIMLTYVYGAIMVFLREARCLQRSMICVLE